MMEAKNFAQKHNIPVTILASIVEKADDVIIKKSIKTTRCQWVSGW